MAIKPNQQLEAVSISIRPLDNLPITKEFFNGEFYEIDGVAYKGYTPVVIGTISSNQNDENYISDEQWESWVYDAYYDVDAYVNKAMTVLGMFHNKPNFSAIPVITTDHMMRAIAAKIEQNLFTNPSNAEVRVTLTQSSGGRTSNIPSRENFSPSDMLNKKVQEYIDGSNIFEVIADSFQAIILDRNDYYTKAEINAIISSGQVPIEVLYTKDVDLFEPATPGAGVNKKYVDKLTDELQQQINALIVGDIEITTNNIRVRFPELESWTGLAEHQGTVNIENKIVMSKLRSDVNDLNKRTGTPLQANKTLGQEIDGSLYQNIINYNESTLIDSLIGFDIVTGEYTISESSLGDNVSFEATLKVFGKPRPGIVSGTATLLLNDEVVTHPVSNLPIEQPIIISSTAGVLVNVSVKDIVIRFNVDGEWNIGDKVRLAIKQSNVASLANDPMLVESVQFDMVNLKTLNDDDNRIDSSNVDIVDPINESLSGLSLDQEQLNKENKTQLEELIKYMNWSNENVDIGLADTGFAGINLDPGEESSTYLQEPIDNFKTIEIWYRTYSNSTIDSSYGVVRFSTESSNIADVSKITLPSSSLEENGQLNLGYLAIPRIKNDGNYEIQIDRIFGIGRKDDVVVEVPENIKTKGTKNGR